ncbi:MAG: hypothetical protein CMJ35_14905 [Phycisphaerae bacterium]|nr:hypothetical protein [Phycisphaerae bacterium]|tara:strand:+ start:124 stop:693 length:570 start_codon:yes stop_codon:yes gene_type:complete
MGDGLRPVLDSITEKVEIEIESDAHVPVMIESRFGAHEMYYWRTLNDRKRMCEFMFDVESGRFYRMTLMATGCDLIEYESGTFQPDRVVIGHPVFRQMDGAEPSRHLRVVETEHPMWIGLCTDRREIMIRFVEQPAVREVDSQLGIAWGFEKSEELVYIRVYEGPDDMIDNLIADSGALSDKPQADSIS